jgi:hypothetical protein
MLARARSAGPLALATTPAILAQNDFLRLASAFVFGLGAGALRLLPVSRLYLARPFAVSPAPLDTGSFSPRPTASDTDLRGILEVGCDDCCTCCTCAACATVANTIKCSSSASASSTGKSAISSSSSVACYGRSACPST